MLVESIPLEIREDRLSQNSGLTDTIAVIQKLEGTGELNPLPDTDVLIQTHMPDDPDYDLTRSDTEQLGSDTQLEDTPLAETPANVIDGNTPTEAIDEIKQHGIDDTASSESAASVPTSTTHAESQPQSGDASPSVSLPTEADPVAVSDEIVVLDTALVAVHMRCLECSTSQFVHLCEPVAEWTCGDCTTTVPSKTSRQLTGLLTDHANQSLPAIENTTPAPSNIDPDPQPTSEPHPTDGSDTPAETPTQAESHTDDSEPSQAPNDDSITL